jgi:hypothetical protein
MRARLAEVEHDLVGVVLGAGDGPPPGDHGAVVAHADPAAPGIGAVLVQGEVQGALGAHGGVGGPVPADQGFVVPQAQLAPPAVAAFGHRDGPFGVELEHLAALMHLQGMGVDAGGAVLPGLPGAPPLAGEDWLLVAGLVAGELSKADAGGFR